MSPTCEETSLVSTLTFNLVWALMSGSFILWNQEARVWVYWINMLLLFFFFILWNKRFEDEKIACCLILLKALIISFSYTCFTPTGSVFALTHAFDHVYIYSATHLGIFLYLKHMPMFFILFVSPDSSDGSRFESLKILIVQNGNQQRSQKLGYLASFFIHSVLCCYRKWC